MKALANVNKKHTLKRLFALLLKYYKVPVIIVAICIILSSVGAVSASVFLKNIISEVIEPGLYLGFDAVKAKLISLLLTMVGIYFISLVASSIYNQLMAIITQGFLMKLRKEMFSKMETLPISYFDQNLRGDIMSTYTNDVDAIRQLISQTIPQLLQAGLTVIFSFSLMVYYSLYLILVVLVAVVFIFFVSKKIGGGSAKYFMKQQKVLAKEEGFIEEMMNGQKVIKVFTHEEESIKDFEEINNELYEASRNANSYANILAPIIHNIGNLLYVIVAIVGTSLYLLNVKNLTLTGFKVLEVGVVVSFLTMSRQFANQFNQVSQQINSLVMALAGCSRIFELVDQESEKDEGYVSLVYAKVEGDEIKESDTFEGKWAWKHPHQDGSVSYSLLRGDIVLDNVDFGYNPTKLVLHDVSVYANPEQKIALVGATGAGKTTITNLINRFYDLSDGKVRYDGININKIKKNDLRRSIGIVLQDTSLFTGTVKENIRYGKLDATDEEVIRASKIANAYDFITRLPDGFDTMLTNDGTNLSQGQRQLLSIARAAIANAPVLILDEATSSIDTRTELMVQKGMDTLMEGRTVFVIAHRLSTIQNADAIMVMDHGRIIERGNHDSLIKEQGVYYKLYTGAFELE